MPLPKIEHPIFHINLPSTNQDIKIRPFTVKEEKMMLIAKESDDEKQIVTVIKQIISNCVLDDIPLDDIPVYDIEFLLIQIRAKSVDNMADIQIRDDHTDEVIDLQMNLDEVTVEKPAGHDPVIKINDKITIKMKEPTFTELGMLLATDDNSGSALYDIMVSCIESVTSGETVHKLVDFSEEEVEEFVGDLSKKHLTKFENFFSTMPKVRHEIKYKNSKDEDRIFVVQGMDAFFI